MAPSNVLRGIETGARGKERTFWRQEDWGKRARGRDQVVVTTPYLLFSHFSILDFILLFTYWFFGEVTRPPLRP